MILCPTYHYYLPLFLSFAVKSLVQVQRTDSSVQTITRKTVQTVKIRESSYTILFLTHKPSLSGYTERYSTPVWLSQKSQYVMGLVEEEVCVKQNTLDLVSIRQRKCSKQRNV